MTADRTKIARQFIEAIPHSKALAMDLIEIGNGVAVIKMPYDARFIGDPETKVIHGGAVSALMDTCGGAAAMSHPDAPISTATIDLRIDYMRGATPEQSITAHAECYHMSRTVAFVRATAHDDDADNPVATATGTFTVGAGKMIRNPPEPVAEVKHRRETALNALVNGIPYIQYLGIGFDRHGDELTGVLKYEDHLIGNPSLPAIHGGVTAAFLEVTGMITLNWRWLWEDLESGALDPAEMAQGKLPRMPKTVSFTVDYLRSGLPRDAYARAVITRSGRRYASVHVTAWQDNYDRPHAQATAHFVMPRKPSELIEPIVQ